MMVYTGIGPRNAPNNVLEVCREIGTYMAQRSWVLRTGAGSDSVSSGCDLAFREGCEEALGCASEALQGLLEVYCSAEGPSKNCSKFYSSSTLGKNYYRGSDLIAKALVRALHPLKKKLAPDHLELHSRNVHQQVGASCGPYKRSHLMILWSPKGEPTEGGTGMSQKIYDILPGRCSQFNIGMFDLGNPVDVEAMWAHLRLIVQSLEIEHNGK